MRLTSLNSLCTQLLNNAPLSSTVSCNMSAGPCPQLDPTGVLRCSAALCPVLDGSNRGRTKLSGSELVMNMKTGVTLQKPRL